MIRSEYALHSCICGMYNLINMALQPPWCSMICGWWDLYLLGCQSSNTFITQTVTGLLHENTFDISIYLFINILRLRQNGRHFSDDILKWIFVNENAWISIKISLEFVSRGPINNIPSLVHIMSWRQAIIWTNDGLGYRRIYASLSLNGWKG